MRIIDGSSDGDSFHYDLITVLTVMLLFYQLVGNAPFQAHVKMLEIPQKPQSLGVGLWCSSLSNPLGLGIELISSFTVYCSPAL